MGVADEVFTLAEYLIRLCCGVGVAQFGVNLLIEAIPEATVESFPVLAGSFCLLGGFLSAWENFWRLFNAAFCFLFLPRYPRYFIGNPIELRGLKARLAEKQEAEEAVEEKEKEV